MDSIPHMPYGSLESFRPAKIDEYLETYVNDIIVQEKIHGSNIVILGKLTKDGWDFKLGSRKKWISMTDNFNNFQSLFTSERKNMENLFDNVKETYDSSNESTTVRIYGEIFGGKYGRESTKGSFKTQTDPNYCPRNDFAFFDIYIDNRCIPIIESHSLIKKHNLKIAPVIYQGPLSVFLKDFDIESFNSVVSKEFYNLDFLDVPKSTEGVTIRTVGLCDADSNEAVILKYKQAWITENRRTHFRVNKKIDNSDELTESCLSMLNTARLDAYKSKNTLNDMTNPKLLPVHMKNIIEDTVEDIQKEFPFDQYPTIKMKELKGLLSKKGFPMLKKYIRELDTVSVPIEIRLDNLKINTNNIEVNLNMIRQRLKMINNRIK